MSVFFKRMKTLCEERKMNLTELSKATGIPRTTLNDWQFKSPRSDKVIIIADFFDVSIDYLFGRTNNRSAHKNSLSPNIVRLIQKAEQLKLSDKTTNLLSAMMDTMSDDNTNLE